MFGLSKRMASPKKPRFINLGCGKHFHPDWINIDVSPLDNFVISHDLRKPLPFPEGSCEVVYHSHVLEHLTCSEGRRFIAECHRVLQPQGILRVVVPDLEGIARLYLQNLEGAKNGNPDAANRHEWITLELLDQMVREESGGEMGKYWQRALMPAGQFVIERMGQEVAGSIQAAKNENYRRFSFSFFRNRRRRKRFRQSGEVHKWMYDAVSLRRLLEETGFDNCRVCRSTESDIPRFSEYMLDVMADGSTRKPDSLFMEARKP